MKFIHSLGQSKKSILRNLFNLIHKDIRSVTGANLRQIAIETNKAFIPGITKRIDLTDYMVYQLPEGEEWRIPLLLSLMQLRNDNWVVTFDEEETSLEADDIQTMINTVCTL